ncbi:MAG: TlpA family protein disulfide reductase [Rikenellaceae bacterium]|nr:TlpA family protein disulfide reductase [Rikenellaceae bacterium]
MLKKFIESLIDYSFGDSRLLKSIIYLETNYPENKFLKAHEEEIKKYKGSIKASINDKVLFFESPEDSENFYDIISQFKGKVLYIDIWATWCGPCIKEFAHLEKFRTQTEELDFIHIFLSVDRKSFHEKWRTLVHHYNLEGYHYRINQKESDHIHQLFGNEKALLGIPHCVIVDRDGNIAVKDAYGVGQSQKLIDQLTEVINN